MENMDINGDVPMPATDDIVEQKFISDLEEIIEEESISKVESVSSTEETNSKSYRYVKIGQYYYMSEIVKPYIKLIHLAYNINGDLFDSNPIDIYSLEFGVTTFNLDSTTGQIQYNEALEKKHIKLESTNNIVEPVESMEIDVSSFMEKYSSVAKQDGGDISSSKGEAIVDYSSIVDPSSTVISTSDSDSIIIEDRDNSKSITITIQNGNGPKLETPNNIKKITIVTDGKKKPRQPLDDLGAEIDSIIVDDVMSGIEETMIGGRKEEQLSNNKEDIGYKVDNYYVYGNYKYDLENIRNKLGKEHTKMFLNRLSTMDIDTYLDPSSIKPVLDKKEIQTNMEIFGNRHNV